jgi:cytoskeletal protein CcmA (bactofilin family)
VLPAGLTLTGSIEGKSDLVVAGTVEGPVELEGDLVIEVGGAIHGDVRVHALTVRGVLTGDAFATTSIRVEPSAILVGDAAAPRVNVVEGAKIRGRVRMTGEPIVTPARRRRREPPPETEAIETAPELAAPPAEPDPSRSRRRKRRRGARKPPAPMIPTVQRQKARRKDRAEPGFPTP